VVTLLTSPLAKALKPLNNGNHHISALIAGCRQNDRASQKELYEFLKGYAMKICYRYQHNQYQVEEIVNEGFTKFFKNIHQFDENRHFEIAMALKGWFKRILVNTCIDYYRKNSSYLHGQMISEETEKIADSGETGLDKLSYKRSSKLYGSCLLLTGPFSISSSSKDCHMRKLVNNWASPSEHPNPICQKQGRI